MADTAAEPDTAVVAPAEDAIRAGDVVIVTLVDGQELHATVVAADPEGMLLRVEANGEGGLIHVATSAIWYVDRHAAEGTRFAYMDPNTTRYFYAPSAFALKRGVGYVSQKEIVATTAAFGLVDGVAIEAGTVLPLLFTPARGAIVGLKLGFPVAEQVHVGGGLQTLIVSPDSQGVGAVGLAFVVVTVGEPDRHVSVGVGQTAVAFDRQLAYGPTPVVVAGNFRLSDTVAFITENWLIVDPEHNLLPTTFRLIPSAGVRFIGRRFAADLGVVPIWIGEGSVPLIPVPWLDVTWNFRTRAADR